MRPAAPTGVLSMVELRAATVRLLTAIEDQMGSEIEMPVDYYWNVPIDAGFRIDADPTLDMGSVFDDVESVSEYASEPADEFTMIPHECSHLAGVLRAIAHVALPPPQSR